MDKAKLDNSFREDLSSQLLAQTRRTIASQTGHHLVLARLGKAADKKHTKGIFHMAVIVLPIRLSHK